MRLLEEYITDDPHYASSKDMIGLLFPLTALGV